MVAGGYNFYMPRKSKLQQINHLLNKVVQGNDLDSKEARELFSTIILNDENGHYFSTLIAALHAKGETTTELLELIKFFDMNSVKIARRDQKKKMIDLSGTGGGAFKSINVSSLASLVVAAGGYTVGKSAYYGITSPTGSGDFFQLLGLDIAKLNNKQVKTAINDAGFCPFFSPFFSPKLRNFCQLSNKIFAENGIKIRTPIHLTTNLCSPFKIKYRLYGINDKKYLPIFAVIFKKLNFTRSLTIYGEPGMPEITNIGRTFFAEQSRDKIKFYSLTPKEMGLEKARPVEVASVGRDQNIIDGLKILKGLETGPKADLVAINAAAAFYILGETKSIPAGLTKAREILSSKKAYQILYNLVEGFGEIKKLRDWESKI